MLNEEQLIKDVVDRVYAELKAKIDFSDIKVTVISPTAVVVVQVTDTSAWKHLVREGFDNLKTMMAAAFGKDRKIILLPPQIALEIMDEPPDGGIVL